ncbi:MAG: adenine-specific methyltransferase EcoRI family protein [Prevotella sp.]
MANKNLNAAKTAKKDEFYTQMSDIEMELQHYWQHFHGKTVLCICDDPYKSN